MVQARDPGDHAVNAGDLESTQSGNVGDDEQQLAAWAWARLCAASRVWIPAESQNRVKVMSSMSVPCPCAAASSRAIRSASVLVTWIFLRCRHNWHAADHLKR